MSVKLFEDIHQIGYKSISFESTCTNGIETNSNPATSRDTETTTRSRSDPRLVKLSGACLRKSWRSNKTKGKVFSTKTRGVLGQTSVLNKRRIREKSDAVQNNPTRSINTMRHSVLCGASRSSDVYLTRVRSLWRYLSLIRWSGLTEVASIQSLFTRREMFAINDRVTFSLVRNIGLDRWIAPFLLDHIRQVDVHVSSLNVGGCSVRLNILRRT